jgi:hypothetical protein
MPGRCLYSVAMADTDGCYTALVTTTMKKTTTTTTTTVVG